MLVSSFGSGGACSWRLIDVRGLTPAIGSGALRGKGQGGSGPFGEVFQEHNKFWDCLIPPFLLTNIDDGGNLLSVLQQSVEVGVRINATRKIISQGWVRFAEGIVARAGVLDADTEDVLIKAFAAVPRDKFVDGAFNMRATEDTALPIGYGQTISKPSTVARMLGLIGLRPGMRVLEIGCGSGYCSAVMAAAGAQVFAVEYVGLLAQRTRKLLDGMSFQNILIHRGDGRRGWKEHAPYDAIVVSAAFQGVEPELVSQIKNPGGRMVAPIGDDNGQILTLWEAKGGGVTLYQLEPCNFVKGQ